MNELISLFPTDVFKIILLIGLSFLIGLEREEEKLTREDSYFFGGVRTYPLIALMGYILVVLSPHNYFLFSIGLLVLGILFGISYWAKIQEASHGITSEMSGILTFLIGGAIAKEFYWIAIAIGVINLLLLQLKSYLEGIAKKIESHEITTLVKFLLLSIVILPIIPNVEFTEFLINPYKTWLIVVAVSSIFYASYWMEKFLKVRQSTLLSGIFGGLYSSTATTVVLAKKAKDAGDSRSYSGSILVATGMMYLRLGVLLYIFNRALFDLLGLWFFQLFLVAVAIGTFWSKTSKKAKTKSELNLKERNPLEVKTALMFAFLFILVMVATKLALEYFGNTGVYSLAAIMGTVDVDPFILGLTQSGGRVTSLDLAAIAILIASVSNNVAKGVYSMIFADRETGLQALGLLVGISVISFYYLVG